MWNRERIRIEAIDGAEINGKCVYERSLAVKGRDRLLALLNAGEVRIERTGRDRYGRTLARVTVDGRDIGQQLIRERLARPYAGGRRSWC